MSGGTESIRTPLARARGLGSARDGVGRWVALRVSAVANVFLIAWFVYFTLGAVGADYVQFSYRLGNPFNAVMMILFTMSAFWHAAIGMREIIEDYVACEALRIASLVLLYMVIFALAVTCIFSVLKIAALYGFNG